MPHRFGVAVPLLWPIDAQAMGQTVITKGTKLLDDKSAGAAHKIEQEWRAAFIDASIGFADRKTDKIQLDHLHRQNPSGLEELVVKLAQQEATTITIPDTWETVLEGKHKREIFPKAVHEAPGRRSKAGKRSAAYQKAKDRPEEGVWEKMVERWDELSGELPLHEVESFDLSIVYLCAQAGQLQVP